MLDDFKIVGWGDAAMHASACLSDVALISGTVYLFRIWSQKVPKLVLNIGKDDHIIHHSNEWLTCTRISAYTSLYFAACFRRPLFFHSSLIFDCNIRVNSSNLLCNENKDVNISKTWKFQHNSSNFSLCWEGNRYPGVVGVHLKF